MSTTSHMSALSNCPTASPVDLIESKFDELAKKILAELKQSNYSREFFQAIDVILSEQPTQKHKASVGARKTLSSGQPKQQQRMKKLKEEPVGNDLKNQTYNDDKLVTASLELEKKCALIMEKQRQQQEQLDNHQQILFDSQYRSLPTEITDAVAGHEQRRANAKSSPIKTIVPTGASSKVAPPNVTQKDTSDITTTKTTVADATTSSKLNDLSGRLLQSSKSSSGKSNGLKVIATKSKDNMAAAPRRDPIVASTKSDQQKQRSAIPQSTITSGIGQRSDGAAPYPICKSATVGGNEVSSAGFNSGAAPGSGLVRQTSLRLNKQTREAQQEFINQQTRPLAASEKLRHRRPTKASIQAQGQRQASSDDESDLDDDDDEDEYAYQNLASRRAYLDQRFISQQEPLARKETLGEQVNRAAAQANPPQQQIRQQVMSTIQSSVRQAPANTANMTVAKQRQRFSKDPQVVRSNTIGGGQMTRPLNNAAAKQYDDDNHSSNQQNEPRSLGGLLTGHDLSRLYKPHMNYSTSLLGNHRLSDDDEIIIIPTTQSPSLLSASVSPVGNQHHLHPADDQDPDRTTGNMDELSERFSISRTKSFWEKLANSKQAGGGGDETMKGNPSPQHDKQYFLSSQRSISSGPNLVADTKGSQSSLLNQIGVNGAAIQTAANEQHYPAAMKSAFDRMDSTGGSGNSHYSGCSSSSSTSGDEQTGGTGVGHLSLAERRSMLAAAAAGATKPSNHHRGRQTANASMNPTINQLVQQEQINRSDRFRQTR